MTRGKYLTGVSVLIRRSALALAGLAVLILMAGVLFKILPAGFLPDEDQGVFLGAVRLPDGASLERTRLVTAKVEKILQSTPGVQDVTVFGGVDFFTSTNNSNVATVIATLKPWDQRKSKDLQFASILGSAQQKLFGIPEALIFVFGIENVNNFFLSQIKCRLFGSGGLAKASRSIPPIAGASVRPVGTPVHRRS